MSDETPCCQPAYPLAHDGTARDARAPAALDPGSAPLDDRDLPALLRWALAFAGEVRLFDRVGPDGPGVIASERLRAVFGPDPLIALAEMQAIDPAAARAALAEDAVGAVRRWRAAVTTWTAAAPTSGEMAEVLRRIRDGLPADGAPVGVAEAEALVAALTRLRDRAVVWWPEALRDWPHHAPHTALLVAALQLYTRPRALLDATVARHMNHGYEAVLGLARRPAAPDRVHVVLGLARHVERHTLAAGTLLDAGRDAERRPIRFALDDEVTVTRTRVADVRGLVMDRADAGVRALAGPLPLPAEPVRGWPARPHRTWQAHGDLGAIGLDAPAFLGAPVGFAVASRVLALAEGARTITLEVELSQPVPGLAAVPFTVRYSTPTIWAEAGVVRAVALRVDPPRRSLERGPRGWRFAIELPADAPPCAPPTRPDGALRFADDLPVLHLTTRHPVPPALYTAAVRRLRVRAEARGVRPAVVSGDAGPLDPEGTFAPFGPQPRPGAAMYVDHPELHDRPITSLTLAMRAVGDTDLEAVYAGYPDAPDGCHVRLEWRVGGHWQPVNGAQAWAPGEDDALTFEARGGGRTLDPPGGGRAARSALRLVLCTDLLHDAWPRVLAAAVQQQVQAAQETQERVIDRLSAGDAGRQKAAPGREKSAPAAAPVIPGPPFVPRAAEMVLHHAAEAEVWPAEPGVDLPQPMYVADSPIKPAEEDRAAPASRAAAIARSAEAGERVAGGVNAPSTPRGAVDGIVHHIDPFGHTPVTSRSALLPPLDAIDAALYIGLDACVGPELLSLLVQVLDGSDDPAADDFELRWEALRAGGWRALAAGSEVVADETARLRRSGRVRLKLPAGLAQDTLAMPAGRAWIRAVIPPRGGTVRAVDGPCTVLDVRAQAAIATRVAGGGAPLPAGAVTGLAVRQAAIKTVEQPYAAFGGRPAESDADFHRRAAERLRHKDRALTPWDYERLVLDAFPAVHKVRCLVHSKVEGEKRLHAPGWVTVVLVGRTDNPHAADPFAASVGSEARLAVQAFLAARAPLGARIAVVDAHYARIEVTVTVAVEATLDHSTAMARVDAALKGLLAPWSGVNGGSDAIEDAIGDAILDDSSDAIEPGFGGWVHASRLLAAIDALPGVVAARAISLRIEGTRDPGAEDYRTDAPHVVITSAARHVITVEDAS